MSQSPVELSATPAHEARPVPAPRTVARARPRRILPLRLIAPVAVLLAILLAILLSGCSGGAASGGGMVGDEAGAPAEAAPEEGDIRASSADRIVARTASLTVHVSDPLDGADEVRRIAERRNGWVSWESISLAGTDATDRYATVTITVPADDFTDTLTELAGIGTLEQRQVSTEDVTDQVIDLQARIDSKRASIKRIEELMERTGSVGDIAAVESELASRQADLEALLAQQKYYASITDFSTISVSLTSPVTSDPNPLWAGLKEGWSALKTSVRVLLVVVGALLPFAVVAALIAVPIVWFVRRRRSAAPVAAEPTTSPGSSQEEPPASPLAD